MSKMSVSRLLLIFSVGVIAIVGMSAPLSAQSTAKPPQACMKASDCKGVLPKICMVCSDGISRCAHWTCASAKCAIETCPGGPQ